MNPFMTGRTLVVLAVAVFAGAPAAAQLAPSRTITLEEAIDMALRNSPLMAQRAGAVDQAESAERTALGDFLPSLSFSSGASLSSTERFDSNTGVVVSGSSDSYNARLSSSLMLFDAGRRFAARSQTRAQTAQAAADLIEQQFAVTLTAKQSFFDVIRLGENIRVVDANLARAEQTLAAAKQRFAVGSATTSDTLRGRLEVNQARQAVLQVESQRRSAMYSLGALVGIDGPVAADTATPTQPQPLLTSDEELIQLAITASPAVRTAELGVDANDAATRVSRAQWWPTLNASGGLTWSNQTASFSGGRRSWNTGLSLSYPLFNGFSREDANARANINLRVSQVQYEDARRQARANAQRAIDAVRLAEQQIALAREAVAVAEEDLRVQQVRYELNASTTLDQIASRAALVQSELDLISARYDYLIARAELEALIGRELQ
ncbi:MAG: TolC family protein [Longimicrobiales bacterium]